MRMIAYVFHTIGWNHKKHLCLIEILVVSRLYCESLSWKHSYCVNPLLLGP